MTTSIPTTPPDLMVDPSVSQHNRYRQHTLLRNTTIPCGAIRGRHGTHYRATRKPSAFRRLWQLYVSSHTHRHAGLMTTLLSGTTLPITTPPVHHHDGHHYHLIAAMHHRPHSGYAASLALVSIVPLSSKYSLLLHVPLRLCTLLLPSLYLPFPTHR